MGKRRREPEADNSMLSTAEYNAVFVDTSLDTHLAMLVSDSDTVLDFKRKLQQEHAKCFPNNGDIWFHSLKVKRKGNFYHLPDFILVCSALHGVKGDWFLSADASGSLECYMNQKASECDTKDPCGVISSDANKILSLTKSLPDGVTEENKISGMIVGQKVEKYSDRTTEFWRADSIENSLGTRSPAKKKRKMKYREAVLPSPTFEDHCSQFHASGEETPQFPQPVLTGCKIDAGEETPKTMPGRMEETAEDADVRCDPSNMECSGVVEGASLPATVKKSNLGILETPANFCGLDNRKECTILKSDLSETLMTEKTQNELGRNAPTAPLEGDTNTDPIKQSKIYKRKKKKLPHDQMIENTLSSSDYCKEDKSFFSNTAEISGILEDGHCDNNSEAPCPLKGTGIKEPDTGHLALKVDNLNQCLEIEVEGKAPSSTNDVLIIDGKDKETDRPDINDEQKVSSRNHDQVLSQSEKIGTLDQHKAHGNIMESVPTDHFLGANGEMGCGGSKMKAKKSGGKNCNDAADGELSENGLHLTPLTSRNLELNTLKHHETAKIDSALPTAETDLNLGSKEDRDLSENHQSDSKKCELDVTTKEANSSAILVDANDALEGIKSNGKNRKKKRSQKAAAMLQDISDVELKTKKGESTGSHTKTSKSRKKDEKREWSMNQELEVMLPSYNNTSAFADPVITPKIGSPSKLLDKNFLEESEIAGNSRKKKAKKVADSNLGKSAVKQTGSKEMNQPDLVEEQREMSLSHDPVSIEFEKLGTSDWHEADGNIRESVQPNSFSCAEEEMGHGYKKKRMAKKSRGKIVDETDGEHSDNGIHLTPITVPNLDLNFLNDPETKRTYSISPSPTAEADLDVGTKEGRNLLVNHEIEVNQPEAGVAIIEPKLPYGLIHASGASDDTHYNHDKRKKKKSKKSVKKIQENEAQKAIGDDGLRHDFEVMLPSSSKVSGCTDPELKSNGVGFTTKLLDGNMVGELKTSRDHRRKQSVKKSANTATGNLDMEPANDGTSGSSAVLLSSATDHSPEETDKGQNISFHKVKLDGSAADSERKVGGATRNESGSMKLNQTLEDVGICEQRMEKKNHSSAGDCLSVLPAIEKENQVNNLKPNRAQKSSEITGIKDKKAKKKTKGHIIASDCLESIPIKDQEVTVEVYSTAEKANNFFDFKHECQHVDSQALSHKTEEKLEEIHHTAANIDDLIRHVEDKDEGINFKHYFLPGHKQDKVASVDKVEATKSSEEVKTVKKVKKRGLPSVSTSTELHDPAKLSENKDGKDKSRVRCSTGRKDGDLIVSSKVSDSGLIDSSRKKHKENTISSSFTKDKSMHLDKSCLERSGIFSGSGRNKRWQSGLNVSDKFVMKAPEKNSLFAKVGSLFQDSSGESSGDENRTKNSDASTCSPSDSSSQSGCSAGESDLSQASARNGSNDAQERTTREKNNAKLDLSASNEVTLDMILRSSKRFKKAKLIASQNEHAQIDSQLEFVPDSQPINE